MTEHDSRSIRGDDAQQDAAQMPGGYGSPTSVGGEQRPGGATPPYDGRRESADIDQGGGYRDGANVGGATGPRVTQDGMTDPDPSGTQGGLEWSPSDEMPATEGDGHGHRDSDPGVGPAHTPGTGRGEDTD